MGDGAELLPTEDDTTEEHRSYGDRAYTAILELIDREHAVVWHEVEANLAERPTSERIDPHHLSTARRRLIDDGVIEEATAATKGGRPITVLGLANRYRRETAFDRASRRKRLLETRYLGWAGGGRETNAIGTGGELVSHASLAGAAADPIGYRLLSEGREVRNLLGAPIPGGPLDDAALLITGEDDPTVLTVMIEVKNLRSWLYPSAVEIYQLLDKASRLQRDHPNRAILPVLVARRVHYLTFHMAKHLGFFILQFDANTQPIRNFEFIDPRFVEEVRQGLGYDLHLTDGGALPRLQGKFRYTVPRNGNTAAAQWAIMGPALIDHFQTLRNPRLTEVRREAAVTALYRAACRLSRPRKPWRTRTQAQRAPF